MSAIPRVVALLLLLWVICFAGMLTLVWTSTGLIWLCTGLSRFGH